MSNYAISTNFGAKDALISGNPAKLILGAQLTTEFNALVAAIATKIDGTTVFAPDGNAAQPSYGFTNNGGTGMYNAAGLLGFATGGIAAMTISAAGNVIMTRPTSGRTLDITGVSSSVIVARIIANGATGGFADWFDGANSLVRGFAGYGSAAFTGAAITDFGIAAVTGTLRLSANNGTSTHLSITNAGGLFTLGATGGDQGAGTLNTQGLFVNSGPVYSGIPQNIQAGNYTLVLADANKQIYGTAAGSFTWTIPANASVAFPIGTAVTFVNDGTLPKTIAITTDALIFVPSGSAGSRTLAVFGEATAVKIGAARWYISGNGLT